MFKLTSLSQRLFVGYVFALISLLVLLSPLNYFQLNPIVEILLSLVVISLIFLISHLFFYNYFLKPVHHLIQIAKELANSNNSLIRAQKLNNDELGDLIDAFNEMINQIQLREEIIVSERDRVAIALEQADNYSQVTLATNKKLEFEVQIRKRIESKLTEFQQFLNSIINSMPSALVAIDENLRVTQWNQEATELSGTQPLDAIGNNVLQSLALLTPYKEWVCDVWDNAQNKSLHAIPFSMDNQIHRYDITVYPLRNAQVRSAVIRIDDVTEKIQLEETIVQTEKIMSLGGMAAGMAHEINNPISAIIQNVQNIQRRIDPTLAVNKEQAAKSHINLEAMNEYLHERRILTFLQNISSSGVRASNLVTNMLQFSRASDLSLQPCLVIDVLEKAINIALADDQLHDIKGNFDLNFDQDFQAPQAKVSGVFNELEQVILNLIKNAAQAINERKLSLNDIDEGVINIHQSITRNQCRIRISDNGIGMEAQTRKRVFEPFFTTKDVGAGTGLGMSVSYFIITSHHKGTMHVESEFGIGTTFEISLPLVEESEHGLPTL
ncbi:MAG: ATP-binding protein [Reinekea sp.]|jgi:PAS domain S-box-containing protein